MYLCKELLQCCISPKSLSVTLFNRKCKIALVYLLFLSKILNAQIGVFSTIFIADGNELHFAGDTFFESGKVVTNRAENSGVLSFSEGISWDGASQESHVDGFVKVYNSKSFSFPVGAASVLQPLKMNDFNGSDFVELRYEHQAYPVVTSSSEVAKISDTHFWALRNSKGKAQLTLTWSIFSNISNLLNQTPELSQAAMNLIQIGGFDGQQWRPIESEFVLDADENNVSTEVLSGAIRSKARVDISKFKAFTLLILKKPQLNAENIMQGITPNGDGKNDTWVIEGIKNFPNAKIMVFNRSGDTVFETANGYNNDWSGNFRNHAEPLPNGVYWYVIDMENDNQADLKGWLYISN